MNKEKILIFGAGAVGVFIGTRLKGAGFDVALYGRKRLHQLSETIQINDEAKTTLPQKLEVLNVKEFDVIFVTTKLYDLPAALKEIRKNGITFNALALTQNGVISKSMLEGCDADKVVRIAIFEGYAISGNDRIDAQDNIRGWQVEDTVRGKQIAHILNQSRIKAETNEHLSEIKAEKLIINCAISALSVIKDKTIGGLLHDPDSRKAVISLIDETYSVLSLQYHLPSLEKVREETLLQLENNSSHHPSLYQDFKQGEKTEIDYFNGQILQWARESNVQVPITESVYEQFKRLPNRAGC